MQFKKEEFLHEIKAEIEAGQVKLDDLKAHALCAIAEERVKYDEEIAQLQTHLDATKTTLKEFEEATSDTWTHLKEGIENRWASARQAIHEAYSKIKG